MPSIKLLGDPEVDIYTDIPKPISNPFPEDIYEEQLISTTIKYINGQNMSYPRVHLDSSDRKYVTAYANETGTVSFRILYHPDVYNVTIIGHNVFPSHLSFTTLALPTLNPIPIIYRYIFL